MHHTKPVFHDGKGDTVSEQQDGLAESLTVRMPDWMRDRLDTVAANPSTPLGRKATDAGSVAREFIAAGLLKHTLDSTHSLLYITDEQDLPDEDDRTLPGPVQENLNSQLTIRMPAWMKTHISDVSGPLPYDVADGTGASTRQLITIGSQLYDAGSFPFGQQSPMNGRVRCPNCYDEGVSHIWERTFEFNGNLSSLFDDLSRERDNPYKEYIQTQYRSHGWWIEEGEIKDRAHPLHGVSDPDQHHPDVETRVTVSHCHLCDHTAPKEDFQRAWYQDQ